MTTSTAMTRSVNRLIKYGMSAYGVLYLIAVGLFIKTNYYRLADNDTVQYLAKHNVSKLGLSRLHGNVTALNNPLIIALIVIGIGLGLCVFFVRRPFGLIRWPGLFTAIGFVIPLLPPYNENLLSRLFLSMGIVAFASLFQFILNGNFQSDSRASRSR